jgi:hypothetical protein
MLVTLFKTGKDGKPHYYTVHDRQQVLDSPYAVCASWRVGMGREREKLHRFSTLAERDAEIRRLMSRRIKDGYRLLYSFSRSGGPAFGLAPALDSAEGAGSGLPAIESRGL